MLQPGKEYRSRHKIWPRAGFGRHGHRDRRSLHYELHALLPNMAAPLERSALPGKPGVLARAPPGPAPGPARHNLQGSFSSSVAIVFGAPMGSAGEMWNSSPLATSASG